MSWDRPRSVREGFVAQYVGVRSDAVRQLLAKRYHLCLKRGSRPEEIEDHPLEKIQELPHPAFIARFGPSGQADGIYDRDNCRMSSIPTTRELNAFEEYGNPAPGTPEDTCTAGTPPF